MPDEVFTSMSTKGQVVLPKSVRERRGWKAGEKLLVEERPEGVLLRSAQTQAHTRYEDVAGCLGPAKRKVGLKHINSVSGNYVRKRWGREYDDVD